MDLANNRYEEYRDFLSEEDISDKKFATLFFNFLDHNVYQREVFLCSTSSGKV